eukprot:CAMPEP_0194760646 /NCGR_PEP_ID=MMETSP0323_2-20130528/13522_1 /TAXON_ID=2866 ORGANISM="Crypthecodinium cohnii, Strain Seligo" /NCGR_SAMPLE_ID=MMETSP0323_2 /ASSEMBLY_ACC=CAM_ASM_000346 /LENGTH=32 /DNA_ID= /DNA_START= /DNA_END= /DNA_ORIENTATION=
MDVDVEEERVERGMHAEEELGKWSGAEMDVDR